MQSAVCVAIVGSREYPDLELVRQFVRRLAAKYPEATLVSGGAQGVDQAAEAEAQRVGLKTLIFLAEWERYGRSAGFRRNSTIVDNADVVVAFWDGYSRGTLDTIRKAAAAKKNLFIYNSLGILYTSPPPC